MEIDTGTRKIVDPGSFREKTSDFIRRFNSEIIRRCEDLSVPVIDLYSQFGSKDQEDLLNPSYAIGDNAHLNLEGQKKIARILEENYFNDTEEFDTVVCLGDSHTQGFPVRNDISKNGIPVDLDTCSPHQFPYWMTRSTGRSFINRGIAGNTLYGMSKRFDNEVVIHLPDHCIIQGGTNDALLGTPFDDSMEDLMVIINRSIENEITPVICTIIPLGF